MKLDLLANLIYTNMIGMSQVPWSTENELIWLCCYQCTLDAAKEIQTHHIDGDRNNNDPDNWTVLCANCHAIATTHLQAKGTMTIKYTPDRLKEARLLVVETCLTRRLGNDTQVQIVNENEKINEKPGRTADESVNSRLIRKTLLWLGGGV
jgi:hypothetical protein